MARRAVSGSVRRQITKNPIQWRRDNRAFERVLEVWKNNLANPKEMEAAIYTIVGYAPFVEFGGKWFDGSKTPAFGMVRKSLPAIREYQSRLLNFSSVYDITRDKIVEVLNKSADYGIGPIMKLTPRDTSHLYLSWSTRYAK